MVLHILKSTEDIDNCNTGMLLHVYICHRDYNVYLKMMGFNMVIAWKANLVSFEFYPKMLKQSDNVCIVNFSDFRRSSYRVA